MSELSAIENLVTMLGDNEYEEFRQWFWNFEHEKWDTKLENDISANKLNHIANDAIADYHKGNFKTL